jgi:hypothetical protein
MISENPYVRQCQKCQKPSEHPFGTFGTPSVGVFGEIHALLCERRGECPGAVPILVCHDEVVVECDADKAEEAKEWLVQAMKDGMDAVVNVMEPHIPIEVEASVSKTWGD